MNGKPELEAEEELDPVVVLASPMSVNERLPRQFCERFTLLHVAALLDVADDFCLDTSSIPSDRAASKCDTINCIVAGTLRQ
mmetsp:Transcript_136255/g.261715  ORF Transcript_136255/g.261715 Transcript_136255/m.261715 type:complete len:82 (+) Transcript_136255:537-782(+)